jgi:hypothetical protein
VARVSAFALHRVSAEAQVCDCALVRAVPHQFAEISGPFEHLAVAFRAKRKAGLRTRPPRHRLTRQLKTGRLRRR